MLRLERRGQPGENGKEETVGKERTTPRDKGEWDRETEGTGKLWAGQVPEHTGTRSTQGSAPRNCLITANTTVS